MDYTLHILILVVLVLGSAYFSGTEAAFLSASHLRLKNLSGNGNHRATLVLRFLDRFDQVLSTLLIGNNLVNILATSIATAMFSSLFPKYGVTIATIVMTLAVLIFGEILPKSIAKTRPEKAAMSSAPFFRVVMLVLTPLTYLFKPISLLTSRFFKPEEETGATEEELITMLDEVEEGGGLKEEESELIRSAIEFNDVDVDEVLTRRVNIVALEDDATMDEARDLFFSHGFSRIPVYHETIDNVVGVLYEKDFMAQYIEGKKEFLSLLKELIYVPKSMKISVLLRELQTSKSHMAIVLDESGGVEGLVTMEDILEELVGEIWDEHDEVEILIEKMGEDLYQISGSCELDEVFETLEIDQDTDEFESTTLGGLMMERLERIPVVGDELVVGPYRFVVTQADKKGVIEVEASRYVEELPAEEESKPDNE